METKEYLDYLINELHTGVVATVDENGLPVTAAIDMMDHDGDSLYFLTAKGRGFYRRLVERGYLSFTAVKGEDPMSCIAITVRGKVRELGGDMLRDLFEKNPYMYETFTIEKAMRILTVFRIYQGTGEWLDLSKKPIERAAFSFGRNEREYEMEKGGIAR